MDAETARRAWRLFEPWHAIVYFAPETRVAFKDAGLKGYWMGYFAGRAAPLGAVTPAVVEATFYNFHHSMVERAIPDAWSYSTPDKVLAARLTGVEAALKRIIGDDVVSPAMIEAARLAMEAARACRPNGRPLFAANAALEAPGEPELALWHACTLLREHRGDGHVAALVTNGIDGCEAHILISADGVVPADVIRPNRGWPDTEWDAAAGRLEERGLLSDGHLTAEGRELRRAVEEVTDERALDPWLVLGSERTERLFTLMEPLVAKIEQAGGIPYPNPMGVPPIREV